MPTHGREYSMTEERTGKDCENECLGLRVRPHVLDGIDAFVHIHRYVGTICSPLKEVVVGLGNLHRLGRGGNLPAPAPS